MPATRFLFARLNLIAQYEDKAQFVRAGLQSNQLRRVREHLWGFFEVEGVDGHAEYLTGYLAKVRPQNAEEVGDLVARSFAMTTVENRAIAKSRFFLHVPTGLLAYQYVSSHIEQRTFEEQFARLFEEGYKQFFVTADVLTVEERANFLDAIRTFDRVQTLSVSLHPTNPHFSEVYRAIDERLKAIDAKDYRETIAADPNGPGLRVTEDSDIRSKAMMAEDGYGKLSASGTRNGRSVQASTSENPITTSVDVRDRSPSQILSELADEFMSIIRRIAA
jgi:hypothetical protein